MKRNMSLRLGSVLAVLSMLALSGCGNDPGAQDSRASFAKGKAFVASLIGLWSHKAAPTADPAAQAAARAALEQAGKPVLYVSMAQHGYANLMAPYGKNGTVTTWASSSLETVALQDGILVATRGFGADLMAARVPSLAEVRQASGYFHRGYSYLDGADQRQFFEYDCTFAPAGTEEIAVLGKSYAARKVIESCEGPESTFQNAYWFDGSGSLRQSDQRLSPTLPMLRLQRIVD